MTTAVATHRIADISKRGERWEVLCECGTTITDADQTAARLRHREHADGGAAAPEEQPVVSLDQYRNQQAEPDDDADSGIVLRCPEPGCGREFSRQNGLTRHRNQAHGDSARTREKPSPPKTGQTRKRHTRREAPPATLDAVGYEIALTLDSERTDVLAALAFIEERDADELIREAICEWLATEVEAEPGLAALAAARARRRG